MVAIAPITYEMQKQPSRGALSEKCSENMQRMYRRTPIPKFNFNKIAKQLFQITFRQGRSPVNLLHIFRTPFLQNSWAAISKNVMKSTEIKYLVCYENICREIQFWFKLLGSLKSIFLKFQNQSQNTIFKEPLSLVVSHYNYLRSIFKHEKY